MDSSAQSATAMAARRRQGEPKNGEVLCVWRGIMLLRRAPRPPETPARDRRLAIAAPAVLRVPGLGDPAGAWSYEVGRLPASGSRKPAGERRQGPSGACQRPHPASRSTTGNSRKGPVGEGGRVHEPEWSDIISHYFTVLRAAGAGWGPASPSDALAVPASADDDVCAPNGRPRPWLASPGRRTGVEERSDPCWHRPGTVHPGWEIEIPAGRDCRFRPGEIDGSDFRGIVDSGLKGD